MENGIKNINLLWYENFRNTHTLFVKSSRKCRLNYAWFQNTFTQKYTYVLMQFFSVLLEYCFIESENLSLYDLKASQKPATFPQPNFSLKYYYP